MVHITKSAESLLQSVYSQSQPGVWDTFSTDFQFKAVETDCILRWEVLKNPPSSSDCILERWLKLGGFGLSSFFTSVVDSQVLFSFACHKAPPNSAEQKSTQHLHDNPFEGSLTTLLIAHVASLQHGRQLDFYVTLLGGFYGMSTSFVSRS